MTNEIAKEKAEKLYYERLKLISPYKDFEYILMLEINTSVEDFNKLLTNLVDQKTENELLKKKL